MTKRALPRGIRNSNPGNIRLAPGTRWLGQVPPERQTDPDFVQFESMLYGTRALCRVLRTYIKRHNLRSVRRIVTRWAPPSENDTLAYARYVASVVGVELDEPVRWEREPEKTVLLVRAVARMENGAVADSVMPEDLILRAAVMAGLLEDAALPETSVAEQLERERPVAKTRTAAGAAVAAGATGAGAVVEALGEAKAAVAELVPYLGVARWVFLALTIVGVGIVVWARLSDRKAGLR